MLLTCFVIIVDDPSDSLRGFWGGHRSALPRGQHFDRATTLVKPNTVNRKCAVTLTLLQNHNPNTNAN